MIPRNTQTSIFLKKKYALCVKYKTPYLSAKFKKP